jgi:hypothetical protein
LATGQAGNKAFAELSAALSAVEIHPKMIDAGVDVFVAWQDGDLSELYENFPIVEDPYHFLARAMWCAMKEVHQKLTAS